MRLLNFGDEMLGVQCYESGDMLNRTKCTYFENLFFFPIGNTVKLKINYWQQSNFHEDISSCVISLERGRKEGRKF